jgi:hypothetical protein
MVAYATKAAFRKPDESIDNLKCSNVFKFTHRISKHRCPVTIHYRLIKNVKMWDETCSD